MNGTFRVDTFTTGTLDRHLNIEDFLNKCASEGWELVSIISHAHAMVMIIHRREKRWWQI